MNLASPSGAGDACEPNIIGAAADCTGIYGQQPPRRPRQQGCNRKYERQLCSMHDAFCFKLIYETPFRRWSWSLVLIPHCKCVYCCRWCWCLFHNCQSDLIDVTLSYVMGSTYTYPWHEYNFFLDLSSSCASFYPLETCAQASCIYLLPNSSYLCSCFTMWDICEKALVWDDLSGQSLALY